MKPELNVGRRSSRKYFLLHHHPLLCEASFLDYSKKKTNKRFYASLRISFFSRPKASQRFQKDFILGSICSACFTSKINPKKVLYHQFQSKIGSFFLMTKRHYTITAMRFLCIGLKRYKNAQPPIQS